MTSYLQMLSILGASLLEIERLRGAPQTNFSKLLYGYPPLFRLFLALCSVGLLVCCVVWVIQPGYLRVVGIGVIAMSFISAFMQEHRPLVYNSAGYIRTDCIISLFLLGSAMFLKVKELF
jgi:hypothetical protein